MPVYGRSRLSARAREERSFEALFKRYHAPLLSYCRHMLGDQDEAEDALQQTFIRAHRALRGGTQPRELRPWLYAIARNCCLSAIAARRPTAPLEDHTPALVGLSDQVHRREDLRELVAGIGRLPEDQRSALLLAELDDLSHQAIAAIVGCPVSKVKALVYQARSALIADRDARGASCQEIREQLSVAHGGELRRGPLRRHLKLCVGCRDFQLAVSAQRQSLAVVLPVLPSAGLAAAILGHSAAHAVGATGIGGAGGLAPAGGATGTSVGVTTTGVTTTGVTTAGVTTAGVTATGGTGIAASGTTAATAAVGASAGAGSGMSVGALVGGGLVTKLAVGGTIVALATAGAVTAHIRAAHSAAHRVTRSQPTSFGTTAPAGVVTDIADSSYDDGPSGPPLGSPPTLALVNGTGPAGAPGTGPSAELSDLGGAEPLLTAGGPPSLVPPGIPGQPAGKAGLSATGLSAGDQTRHAGARAKRRRAALHRRRLRRARLRRHRLAARRARLRKALRRHPRLTPPKPPAAPKPVATPAPVHVTHRKARTTPAPGTVGAPAGTAITGSAPPRAGTPRHPKSTSAGAGTSTATGTGKTGSGTAGGGSGAGGTSSKAKGSGSSGAGSTSSKTKAGGGEASGTSTTGSNTGAGGQPSGAATGAGETAGAGTSRGTGTQAHPKKHLVEEEQLPNL
jgi:RNA polymerase sigma factor (sigma-70 family)